eukprot:scaffold61448_cov48-Phaeocystis_antarctica.AAC.4
MRRGGHGHCHSQRWGGPHLHRLGMAKATVVGHAALVVVAHEAALCSRAAGVSSHRTEGRAAPTELRRLLEHELVLHVPEAASPKIDLHVLLLDGVGW